MTRHAKRATRSVHWFAARVGESREAIATWATGATVATAALVAVGACCASAAEPASVPPAVAALVPMGWTVLAHATGDLNGDALADSVLLITPNATEPTELTVPTPGPRFDTRPRRMLTFLRDGPSYRLVSTADQLVPAANESESPCAEDPFEEVAIKAGVARVSLSYWTSCGSWGTSAYGYSFKFERSTKRMRLFEVYRHSGSRTHGEAMEGWFDVVAGSARVVATYQVPEERRVTRRYRVGPVAAIYAEQVIAGCDGDAERQHWCTWPGQSRARRVSPSDR